MSHPLSLKVPAELDALQFEEEEEGASYLADISKEPDFIDEQPPELSEACLSTFMMLRQPDLFFVTA